MRTIKLTFWGALALLAALWLAAEPQVLAAAGFFDLTKRWTNGGGNE